MSDSKGTGDFGVVDVLVNNFIDGRKACYLAYLAPSNTLFLWTMRERRALHSRGRWR